MGNVPSQSGATSPAAGITRRPRSSPFTPGSTPGGHDRLMVIQQRIQPTYKSRAIGDFGFPTAAILRRQAGRTCGTLRDRSFGLLHVTTLWSFVREFLHHRAVPLGRTSAQLHGSIGRRLECVERSLSDCGGVCLSYGPKADGAKIGGLALIVGVTGPSTSRGSLPQTPCP